MSPSSGLPPRSHSYFLLESLFTIPRASEIKASAKSSLLLHLLHPRRYIDTNDRDSIKIYKNRNTTFPPSASCIFPCLTSNRPISTLSCDSSANADHDHTVPSCFIISSTCHFCFLEPMCSSPNLILDGVKAGCEPVLHCSCHRLHSCSG